MSKFVLALDQGTTSSRAIVFDRSGKAVSSAQQEFPQIFPGPGHVEHDPEAIWSTQLATAKEAIARAGISALDIAAIGVTNQRETTVLWEKATGKPIANAIVWQSRVTAPICDRLKAAGHEATFRQKTGLVVDAYFSGTKIKHLLDSFDGLRDRAARGEMLFGTIDTFLIWRLTGGKRHVTDVSNASRTLIFNIHTMQWDDELLEAARHAAGDAARGAIVERGLRRDRSGALRRGRFRSPATPAISRRRSSARPASSRARRRTPTAPAASCCSTPATSRCRRRRACSRRSRGRSAARRPTRSKARCSSPAPRCSGCATA